ncbi:MAG: hypothetical protein SVY53_05940 [Chloroflexota bacterium]|nr:hypothetical protein [Chloroflexota bacterium]
MGYPTDVRVQSDQEAAGINLLWQNSGTDLSISETRTLVNITGKAGKLLAARLFAKNPNVWLKVAVDGEDILEVSSYFMSGYSCTGEGLLTVCRKYDTVNDRYIMELSRPIEFGSSLLAQLVNWTGSAAKAFSHVLWIENT